MYLLLALLSAVFAALVAVFGKLGLAQIDSTLATTVRAIIMAGSLVLLSVATGRFSGVGAFTGRAWLLVALSGLAGAASWLAYFAALRLGPATTVAALDRLSVVFVIALSALFLGEALTWRAALGGLLMTAGALIMVR